MADPTIVTRSLERSDIPEVLELLRASLGEPPLLRRTPELFAWKHFDNPFGQSVALLAETAGQLIGLRTFMRWDLDTPSGARVRCVRAVDTATHPDFQRRGIFRRLTEEAVEVAKANGIDLIFNTPNQKSGSGYLSMGWVEVGKIGVLVRPRRHLLGRDLPRSEIGDLIVGAGFDVSDTPPDRAPLGLRTHRSTAYRSWRFGSHPTARYAAVRDGDTTVVARGNVRNGRPEVLIAETMGPNPSAGFRKTIRSARAGYVATWFSKGTPERRAALKSGMIPVPGVAPLTLVARPLRDLETDVGSMASWDLALSDLELL